MGRRSSRGAESSDDDTFKSFSDEYGSTTSGSDDDTDYSDGYTFSESENGETEEESQVSCIASISEVSSKPSPKPSPKKPMVAKLPQIMSQGTPRKQNLSKPVPLSSNEVQSTISVMSILSAIDSAVDAVVDTIIPKQEAKETVPKREKSPIRRENPERKNPLALIRTLSGKRSALNSSKATLPKSKSSKVASPKVETARVASPQAASPRRAADKPGESNSKLEPPKRGVGARMKSTFSPRLKERQKKEIRSQEMEKEKEQIEKDAEESNFFKRMGYSTFDWVSPTNDGNPSASEEIVPKKKCTDILRKNKAYDAQVRDDQSVRSGRSGRSRTSKKTLWKSSRSMKEESRDMPESEDAGYIKTGSEWWGDLVGAFPGYEEESFESYESSAYEEVEGEAKKVRRKNLFRRRSSRKGDDTFDDSSTNTSTKKPKTKTKIKWFGRKKDEELKKEYEGILY
uniref:Uncharacterized protein n=1 Tax=Chaetoceros debilis TaxID=122233 RepID=A0A7S3V5V5_9STRA|mmetsp:Transcript_19948/g.30193  ORF Transcript_19948/g.30193 Transcript_19948/m.30193 type:complete len:457 (+) Transcript_19948:128-1498(+)